MFNLSSLLLGLARFGIILYRGHARRMVSDKDMWGVFLLKVSPRGPSVPLVQRILARKRLAEKAVACGNERFKKWHTSQALQEE